MFVCNSRCYCAKLQLQWPMRLNKIFNSGWTQSHGFDSSGWKTPIFCGIQTHDQWWFFTLHLSHDPLNFKEIYIEFVCLLANQLGKERLIKLPLSCGTRTFTKGWHAKTSTHFGNLNQGVLMEAKALLCNASVVIGLWKKVAGLSFGGRLGFFWIFKQEKKPEP